MTGAHHDPPHRYRIRVRGHLGQTIRSAFPALQARASGGDTVLTGPEIAGELYVSSNTVKSHMRSLYAKLGTHHRAETVTLARDLGLLAPSPLRSQATRPG